MEHGFGNGLRTVDKRVRESDSGTTQKTRGPRFTRKVRRESTGPDPGETGLEPVSKEGQSRLERLKTGRSKSQK